MDKKIYIDVSKCREDFYNDVLNILTDDTTNDRANEIIDVFDSLPAADVQEVKHGKWIAKKMIKESYNYGVPYEIFRCSECSYMLSENGLVGRYNHCPNCGARMDGKEVEK